MLDTPDLACLDKQFVLGIRYYDRVYQEPNGVYWYQERVYRYPSP